MSKCLKIAGICLAAIMTAGCTPNYSGIEGYADISRAKELYAALDSGHFYMQDNSTGLVTQEFTFKYRENGSLSYSYVGSDGDAVYFEYHTGGEINYKNKGDEQWTVISQGQPEYYSYSRKNKHPMASENTIALNAYAVTDSKVEETDEGEKIILSYDHEKLKDSLAEIGELKSFESTIWLNSDGYCCRLDQKGVFENEGEFVSDFSMFIDRMNEVAAVGKPEE